MSKRSINELLKGFDVGSITFIELQSLGNALREARTILERGTTDPVPLQDVLDLLESWGTD